MGLIPQLTDAGKAMMVQALTGSTLNFTCVKIGDADAPSTLTSGDYWYDTENMILHQYLDTWVASDTEITISTTAPDASTLGAMWYNPSTGVLYKCSEGWVAQSVTITCSTSAPSSPAEGDYWYDTANEIFYIYSHLWSSLSTVNITCSEDEPESPSEGDYWYSINESLLKICTEAWLENSGINIAVSDTEPEDPSDGDYWYDTANSELKVCTISETTTTEDGSDEENATSTAFWTTAEETITYSSSAPSEAAQGDWWLDSASNVLMIYGTVWETDTAQTFTYGSSAPSNPTAGDWWYDTSLHVYEESWVPDTNQNFTYGSTSPTSASSGDWWYSSSNSTLYEYGNIWATDEGTTFSYASSTPSIAYSGDYWYNTATGTLMEFMSGWFDVTDITMTYSSLPPSSPSAGDWWYSTSDSQLYEYNGTSWTANYASIVCSISAPDSAEGLSDLINPLLTAPITEITQGTNYVQLVTKLSNADLTTGFEWSETGVFAQIDGGEEELYAYCNSGDLYDYIPSNDSGRTLDVTFTLMVMVGDAESVSATISEGTMYASKATLEEHIHDANNPHQVTAEQVGLGNVENVAPADMAITYETAEELEEPTSGETMSTFMGKVKKAIATLITHLKASNPHGITAAKIGAATTDHTHYVCGTYTGDGTTKRLISVGFTPSAVIVVDDKGRMYDDAGGTCGGVMVGSYGVRCASCTVATHATSWSVSHTAMLIGTNGFYVNYYSSTKIYTNTSNTTYRYIAFK